MNAKASRLLCAVWTVVFVASLFVGCNNENDMIIHDSPENKDIISNEIVFEAFSKKYPEATNVSWESSGIYLIANFTNNSKSARAWFNESGQWFQYKAIINLENISPEVLENLKGSEYGAWNIDQAKILERHQMGDVYIIETKSESAFLDLYFTNCGKLIKEMNHSVAVNETPVPVPNEIKELVSKNYNGTVIYDLMIDSYGSEIGIIENDFYKTIVLDYNYDWLCTLWDLEEEMVPLQVMRGFTNSKYSTYTLNRIKSMIKEKDKTDTQFYLFYLYGNDKNTIVTFNKNGGIDIAISA